MALRNILVTGANKGIGEAIVRKILSEHNDAFVLLGSRNIDNGISTKNKILQDIPKSEGRLEVLVIDVSNDESVQEAAEEVTAKYKPLYGLVNNAGVWTADEKWKDMIETNFMGVKRVFDNFHDLISKGGKVVNVTSGAGPMYVNYMNPGNFKNELISKDITWNQIETIMSTFMTAKDSGTKTPHFADMSRVYHFSKALANAYTLLIAREHPDLVINACTPGYIATDLVRSHWESQGKTPDQIGCKPVEEGAHCPCKLLFDVTTSGSYYGGDGVRSPLHKFRRIGEPEYHAEYE